MIQERSGTMPAVVRRSRIVAAIVMIGLLFSQAVPATQAPSNDGYDLLLKGGRILDPANGVDRIADLAIRDGRIAAIEDTIAPERAKRVFDVTDLLVAPGLVDIHFHAYAGTRSGTTAGGIRSIFPDQFAPRSCTTTVVDPGTAGWREFEEFRRTIIDVAQTRTLAMLNISGMGILAYALEQNPEDLDPKLTAEMATKHSDVVVGIKSAHWWAPTFLSVQRAIEAGKAASLPIMVDFGYFLPDRPYEQMVAEILRPGDMSTHFYRWPAPLLDEKGRPRDYLVQARERGVKFDVGHGGGSFHYRNAEPMIRAGFYPDSISTDAHLGSVNAGMIDLPAVMSRILVLGMPLREVIRASTSNPADQIRRPRLGRIGVGSEADLAVLSLSKGNFSYRDALGGLVRGDHRLRCEITIRAGRVVWDDNGISGKPWREAGLSYPAR
jgi:dihydroorotase